MGQDSLVDDAPADYIAAELAGIVGVELRITRLDAKRKLSQNRAPADVAGVIEALSAGTPAERVLAAEMARTPARHQTARIRPARYGPVRALM